LPFTDDGRGEGETHLSTKKSSTKPTNPNPSPAASPASPPVITSVSTAKVAAEVSFQTLVAGFPIVFAGETSFILPSGTYTVEELLGPFQKRIAAAEATKAAETAWHDAVAAERPIAEEANALRKEVKQLAAGRFGASSSVLSQLGYTPDKPRKVTAAVKAGSAAKARATRAAKKTPSTPPAKPGA
jgi:hypothetical protein